MVDAHTLDMMFIAQTLEAVAWQFACQDKKDQALLDQVTKAYEIANNMAIGEQMQAKARLN